MCKLTTYCGLDCDHCDWKEPCHCEGCIATKGFAFHCKDEPCPVAACAIEHKVAFCGDCREFPCKLLTDYTNDPEHGDTPPGARIEHCKELRSARLEAAIRAMRYDWVNDYLVQKPGVTRDFKQEWNWMRFQIGGKLFAAILLADGKPYYINVRLDPMEGDFLRQQYEDIVPGYYSNKQHWNSIKPNGAVPDELVRELLDKSYQLVFEKLTKKLQREILEHSN